jgi:hypothetical protein
MIGWDQYGFDKKRDGTHYAKLLFLLPMGSVGHVVHSVATGAQNIDPLFLCSSGHYAVSIKSASGHVTSNLCFWIRWDLRVT